MALVEYNGDLFITYGINKEKNKEKLYELQTRLREKALRHNFEEVKPSIWMKWVPLNEVKGIGPTPQNLYRVKYKDDYFKVSQETEDTVSLYTNSGLIARKYGLKFFGYYDWSEELVVQRDEITEMQDIKERVGLRKKSVRDIYLIVDENEDSYLLREINDSKDIHNSGSMEKWGWKRVKGCYQKWFPKEEVFVYNATDEPLRY